MLMDIDSLTIAQAREIRNALGNKTLSNHPYEIGENYFIQTVTHYYTGRLIQVLQNELILEEASWIADTGRFKEFIQDGKFNEVEPYPSGKLIIGRGSLVQAFEWTHKLPRDQKAVRVAAQQDRRRQTTRVRRNFHQVFRQHLLV